MSYLTLNSIEYVRLLQTRYECQRGVRRRNIVLVTWRRMAIKW